MHRRWDNFPQFASLRNEGKKEEMYARGDAGRRNSVIGALRWVAKGNAYVIG
jgi:hypothetical protein